MKSIMMQQENIIAQLRFAEQGVRTEYQVLRSIPQRVLISCEHSDLRCHHCRVAA